jgi:hypothetical protein
MPNTAPSASMEIVYKAMVNAVMLLGFSSSCLDVLGVSGFCEGLGWIGVIGVGVIVNVPVSLTDVCSLVSEWRGKDCL